uniref:Uncharacterized protein n=1 Tax=Romanomermis culicivorax TaxID=13658 RepID=A0A915IM06_ROMCU
MIDAAKSKKAICLKTVCDNKLAKISGIIWPKLLMSKASAAAPDSKAFFSLRTLWPSNLTETRVLRERSSEVDVSRPPIGRQIANFGGLSRLCQFFVVYSLLIRGQKFFGVLKFVLQKFLDDTPPDRYFVAQIFLIVYFGFQIVQRFLQMTFSLLIFDNLFF